MEMRSSLARVQGLGAAKEGPHHWWVQRATAVALVPLSIWFVISMLGLLGADHATFVAWSSTFGNLVLMILFVAALFQHAQLGVQVVIEDYVHSVPGRVAGIMLVRFAAIAGAASSIIALLLVAFRG